MLKVINHCSQADNGQIIVMSHQLNLITQQVLKINKEHQGKVSYLKQLNVINQRHHSENELDYYIISSYKL